MWTDKNMRKMATRPEKSPTKELKRDSYAVSIDLGESQKKKSATKNSTTIRQS
jgi:hypothetical protein